MGLNTVITFNVPSAVKQFWDLFVQEKASVQIPQQKSLNIINFIDFEFKGSLKTPVCTHDVCNKNACWPLGRAQVTGK